MKQHLERLYNRLEALEACFEFGNGWRSPTKQADIVKRWHKIADRHGPDDARTIEEVNYELRQAGLANEVKGWEADGTAKGGPPKTSRHTAGEAADMNVLWPDDYDPDLGRFQAAASSVGLCGPIKRDDVHVELPYLRGKDRERRCYFR
jgi:hypothetical protein